MRSYRFLLAAGLLAGCEMREAGIDNAADGSAASPAVPPGESAAPVTAPPPLPATPAASDSIPAAFLGVYDGSREACGRPSDERLSVAPRELRFHESIGTVRGVTVAGADAVNVEADYQGEGESWRSVRELRLSDGGSTLSISGDGTRLARVRCPG